MTRRYKIVSGVFCSLGLMLSFANHVFAQTKDDTKKDSLLSLLAISKEDTGKVDLLIVLSGLNDPAQGLIYATQAQVLSQRLKWQKGIGLSYFAEGKLVGQGGKLLLAMQYFLKCRNIFKDIGDYGNEFRVSDKIAVVHTMSAHKSEAYATRVASIALAREHHDTKMEAEAFRFLGNDYVNDNNQDKALENWLQSARLKLETGDTTGGEVFSNIGVIYGLRKNYIEALDYYNQALSRSVSNHDLEWQAKNLREIGTIKLILNEHHSGIELLTQALHIRQALGDKHEIAIVETTLGNAYQDIGDYNIALQHFFTSLTICEEIKDAQQVASNLNDLTVTYNAAGENQKALELLKKSIRIFTAQSDTAIIPLIQSNLATVYAAVDSNDIAVSYFEKSISTLTRRQWWLTMSGALIGKAEIYNKMGQHPLALNALYPALKYTTDSGEVIKQAQALGAIGRAYLALASQHDRNNWPDSLARYPEARLLHKAIAFLISSIKLSLESGHINNLADYYKMLSEAQEASGDKADALTSYKAHILYRDSLLSTEKVRAFTRRDMQYDFEKTQATEKYAYERRLAVEAEHRRSGIRLAILSGAGVLLMLATGFYFQRKRSHDRYAVQILELKQEALNAQMSDHFIGNTMDSINGFIVANDRENASRYLVLFSRLIRRVLENATQKLVTVREDLEVLRDYIALEKLRFAGDLQYEIRNPDGLNLDGILIPPMIFQTLAENAIKHGFSKATSGKLLISLNRKSNVMECVVEDNGVGRTAAMKARANGDTPSRKSLGIGIAEKLISTGSQYLKETTYRITDLLNKNNEPAGTRITFVLPLIQVD